MQKYRLLREAIEAQGWAARAAIELGQWQLRPAPQAERYDIEIAHDPIYCEGVFSGSLDAAMVRRIGFPWSPELLRRSLTTVGGCLAGSRSALKTGFSAHLAGGTHHAMRAAGEGYCVFNDQAVAALSLLKSQEVSRVAILDCDVHQGNGTAEILNGTPAVLICDIFCQANFPFRKELPQNAFALEPNCGDGPYLEALDRALGVIEEFRPGILLYQMGVDGLKHDRLGKMNLSFDGLMTRDQKVFEFCQRTSLPVSLALGGGYSDPIDHSVQAALNTFRVARTHWGS